MSSLPTIRRSYHKTTGMNVSNYNSADYGTKLVDKPSMLSERNDYESMPYQRRTELQSRLTPIVLLELHKDGTSEYLTLTLRGLYDHVMKAITNRAAVAVATNLQQPRDSDGPSASPPILIGSPELTEPPKSLRLLSPCDFQHNPSLQMKRGVHRRSVSVSHDVSNTSDQLPDEMVQQPQHQQKQQQIHLHYRQRLGGYLHPRDMRRLITPFSSSNEPELIVRRHVMLLNFDPLRAIALRDRLLVLVPQGADSILLELEKQVRGRHSNGHGVSVDDLLFLPSSSISPNTSQHANHDTYTSKTNKAPKKSSTDKKNQRRLKDIQESEIESDPDETTSISSHTEPPATATTVASEHDKITEDEDEDNIHKSSSRDNSAELDDEWNDFEGMSWIDLPFELQSVDAVLSSVVKMLSEDATNMTNRGLSLLQLENMNNTMHQNNTNQIQEKLRYLKDEVKEMESRVQGFVRAMNLVLDDDEDMALMNLSRLLSNPERFIQPVSQQILEEESDEPELILEAHLQQALGIVNALHLLQGKIVTTEELVSLQMDTIRNRLLYINTLVSVISLCIGIGSFVGSIFGMNLTNHMETAPNAFVQVVCGTIGGCMFILFGLLYIFHMAGSMPVALTSGKNSYF